jgi:hypothetical protein
MQASYTSTFKFPETHAGYSWSALRLHSRMAAALAALMWSGSLRVCARLGDARATMEIPNASATSGLLMVFMVNLPSMI